MAHENLTSLFTDIANAIRQKKGTSAQIVADNFPSEIASISSGNKIVYSGGCSKISNTTSYTATDASVTIPETGNYKFTWFHYAYASSASYYLTRLYKGNNSVGSTHAAPAYNGTPSSVTENSIGCTAGDVITVRARARSGSSYYTVVCGLVAEKL